MATIVILFASSLGAFATFYLHNAKKLDVVTASALPSLVFAVICKLLGLAFEQALLNVLPIVFFGATFVGMSDKKRLTSNIHSILGGGLFGLIYIFFSETFTGYGGGLGTTAAISVLVTIGITNLFISLFKLLS